MHEGTSATERPGNPEEDEKGTTNVSTGRAHARGQSNRAASERSEDGEWVRPGGAHVGRIDVSMVRPRYRIIM